jgi:hypothetical protein
MYLNDTLLYLNGNLILENEVKQRNHYIQDGPTKVFPSFISESMTDIKSVPRGILHGLRGTF